MRRQFPDRTRPAHEYRLGILLFLPVLHPLERGRQVHVQIEHQIRPRQAHAAVLQIEQPVQEFPPLSFRQLGGWWTALEVVYRLATTMPPAS